jgi:hypothetical protein
MEWDVIGWKMMWIFMECDGTQWDRMDWDGIWWNPRGYSWTWGRHYTNQFHNILTLVTSG